VNLTSRFVLAFLLILASLNLSAWLAGRALPKSEPSPARK